MQNKNIFCQYNFTFYLCIVSIYFGGLINNKYQTNIESNRKGEEKTDNLLYIFVLFFVVSSKLKTPCRTRGTIIRRQRR